MFQNVFEFWCENWKWYIVFVYFFGLDPPNISIFIFAQKMTLGMDRGQVGTLIWLFWPSCSVHFHAKPLSPRRLFQNGLTFLSFAHTVFGMIIPSQKLLNVKVFYTLIMLVILKTAYTHTHKKKPLFRFWNEFAEQCAK